MRRFIGSFSGATSATWLTVVCTAAWDFTSGSVSESSACVTGLAHWDWYLCNIAGPYNHFCMSNFAKGKLRVTKSAGFDLPSIWGHCCGSVCCLIRLILLATNTWNLRLSLLIYFNTISESDQKNVCMTGNSSSRFNNPSTLTARTAACNSSRGKVHVFSGATLFLLMMSCTWTWPYLFTQRK